jgi:hypothetical protein
MLDIELKVAVRCKFCGAKLDYEINGSITDDITLNVEPCDSCTDQALTEAWNTVKKQHKKNEVD